MWRPPKALGTWITSLALPVVQNIYKLTDYHPHLRTYQHFDGFDSHDNCLTWFLQRKSTVAQHLNVEEFFEVSRLVSMKRWISLVPNLKALQISVCFFGSEKSPGGFDLTRKCHASMIPIIVERLRDWEMKAKAQKISFDAYCEGCHGEPIGRDIAFGASDYVDLKRLMAKTKSDCSCEEKLRVIFQELVQKGVGDTEAA